MKKKIIFFLLWTTVVIGCSAFESKNTVQVSTYPPPKITALTVNQDSVNITIASDMYYPNYQDFNYYIILRGNSGTDFQSAIDRGDVGDLVEVKTFPNYFFQSEKPSSSGNYLNPITLALNMTNFQSLKTYDFAVVSYGYNESYGRLFDNNGWLYSKASSSQSLHIPISTNVTLDSTQDIVVSGAGWAVSTNQSAKVNSVDFVFQTNINSIDVSVIMPKGNVGITPLGQNSGSFLILPDSGYVDGSTDGNYFVLVKGSVYALKNITPNTYARLKIESVSSTQIQLVLIYSTSSGQRNF